MKWTYANFQAVYEATMDFGVIQKDSAAAKPVNVAAIKEAPVPSSDYQDEKIKASMLFVLAVGSLTFPSPTTEELPAALPLQMGHPAPFLTGKIRPTRSLTPLPTGMIEPPRPPTPPTTGKIRPPKSLMPSPTGRIKPLTPPAPLSYWEDQDPKITNISPSEWEDPNSEGYAASFNWDHTEFR